MATLNEDGSTNMNILTYATPVSVKPDRVWALGIYKDTLSYENFLRTKSCLLQLLREEHVPLVKLLGGTSGRNVNKKEECHRLGFEWTDSDDGKECIQVLPRCAYYIKISSIEDVIDAGSHAVALCRVDGMFVHLPNDDESRLSLSTARLRELGIITEQGRVTE
jgi:flavin reductase (DIM6/NTAB) family NADH-FMN oxidoreductase RutF